MSDAEYPFDPLIQKFILNGQKMEKQLAETKNPLTKAELMMDSIANTLNEYFTEIAKLSDNSFEQLFEKRRTILKMLGDEINKSQIKKLSASGTMPLEDIGMISIISQLETKNGNALINKTLRKISKDNIKRILSLEVLGHFEMLTLLVTAVIKQDPLNRLEEIVKRRFGSDLNWSWAVMILALHENLVKKKLIDLGMTQDEIDNFLRDKGRKFSDLVDYLATKINEIEHRTVGISFFKSSALREIRNRLEHEGYKQHLSHDEVLDLIGDIEKFERELFQHKKS